MSNESNWAGQIGAQNPTLTASDFKSRGMNDTQAAEAASAGSRTQQGKQG